MKVALGLLAFTLCSCVNTQTAQMRSLEADYRAGRFSREDYERQKYHLSLQAEGRRTRQEAARSAMVTQTPMIVEQQPTRQQNTSVVPVYIPQPSHQTQPLRSPNYMGNVYEVEQDTNPVGQRYGTERYRVRRTY